jgi:hypothetical protein
MLSPMKHCFCRALFFSLFDWRAQCLNALRFKY